jgi:hypothetical protein
MTVTAIGRSACIMPFVSLGLMTVTVTGSQAYCHSYDVHLLLLQSANGTYIRLKPNGLQRSLCTQMYEA